MQKTFPAIFALLVLLASCASDAPPPVKPDFNPPATKLNFGIHNLSFMDRSGVQPADSPYMTNNFHPTIVEAIRTWATDRLQATGGNADGVIIVKDASLTAQALPHSDSMFKREQALKYTAHASVEIEIKGQGSNNYALANAEASRFETLPENPTAAERQNAYMTVLNGLMHDLTANLESSIQEHMQNYLVTAPIMHNTPYQP